jgi:hypothetical protein
MRESAAKLTSVPPFGPLPLERIQRAPMISTATAIAA